jgi:hypothetical protein
MAEQDGVSSPRETCAGDQVRDASSVPPPERFEAVVNSISDGVLTVDRGWRITCFNRPLTRTTASLATSLLAKLWLGGARTHRTTHQSFQSIS